METTSSVDGMKTCPYCKAKVPEKAIYCNECKTNLLADYTDVKRELADPPPLGATLAAGVALLLLLFLTAIMMLEVNNLFPYAFYIFIGVITFLLAIVSARGRYGTPSVLHYILSFVIVIIPVIGTLYGVYYTSRSLARARGVRYALYLLLLGVGVVAFLHYGDINDVRALLPVAAAQEPTPTLMIESTATPLPEPTPTFTPKPKNTATPVPTEVPQELVAQVAECSLWSEITQDDVGEKGCVYGEYVEIYQKSDEKYVMSFGDEDGAFQLWSWPKPMEQYLPEGDGKCVVARGWIKTSGIRPIIILRTYDTLESCE